FFIPPRNKEKKVPERIWILFGGNASKALDWSYFVAASPFENDGFLLIEYPGYGFCTGSPSPKTIEESAETAFAALGRQLHLNPAELQSRLCAAGHSIGCGAALNFAVRYPPRQLILISPFTSLRDMARRMVGSPLCYVVRGNFDNRARIRELAALSSPPRIAIFHGADDELIPSAMGRELSLIAPQIVRFNEIPDAEHNDIVSMAEGRIFTAMRE
ncbi:MAG: alpha/beta hydrolase, partial [Verrucomicrobiota bacterium]